MKKELNMSEICSKHYWQMSRSERKELKEWRKNHCYNKWWCNAFLEERFLSGKVYPAYIPIGLFGIVRKIIQVKCCSHRHLRDMGGFVWDEDPDNLSIPHICKCCGTSVILKRPMLKTAI